MWPSEAGTCQRMRYSPGFRPWACDARVSGGASLVIASDCVEASGLTSVRRERVASMRTLKRSLMGMLGPATMLRMEGLDSNRMACAAAGPTLKNMAKAPNKHTTKATLGPGRITLASHQRISLRRRLRTTRKNKLQRNTHVIAIRGSCQDAKTICA